MNPFDPNWYKPDNLIAEWHRKNLRAYTWRAATLCVLLAVWMTPPLWGFAGLIDTVGIDGLLALIELNVLVGLALFLRPLLRILRPVARRFHVFRDARLVGALFFHRGWPQT
jgi:hypothetical protein